MINYCNSFLHFFCELWLKNKLQNLLKIFIRFFLSDGHNCKNYYNFLYNKFLFKLNSLKTTNIE